MDDAYIPSEDVDDFIMVRATAFVSKVQRTVTREVLRDENLPVLEWRLLFSVARFGSCHLAYITRRTSIDPAHGSRAASALEAKGYIVRRDDPDNKRRKLISLTPEGIRVFDRIWPQVRGIVSSVTDKLTPEEFSEAKRLFDLIIQAADELSDGSQVKRKTSAEEDKPYAAE